jgi:hypothetical protein
MDECLLLILTTASPIITIITFILLLLFAKHYLPSYFIEKAKNLATKEDIGDITENIESVKTQYSIQLERIKSKISEIESKREEYLREQRACLLKFYDQSIELFYDKLSISFGDIPLDKGASLAEHQKSYYQLVSELLKSYQRIVIYFGNNEKVRIEAEKTLIQILETRKVMKKNFGKIKFSILDEENAILNNDKEKYGEMVKKSDEAVSIYWDAMSPIMDKLRICLQAYLTELNLFLHPDEIPVVPEGMFSKEEKISG